MLNLGLTATYALTAKEWDIDAGAYRPNRVGLRNEPRVRAILSAAWSNGPWGAGLRFNYTSARALNNDETDYADWSEAACRKRLNPSGEYPCFQERDLRTDLSLRYSGFKNLNLGLNVLNVFDEAAPISLRDGFSLRPRAIKVTMDYKF